MFRKLALVFIFALTLQAKTIIDPLGRSVQVPQNPKKIVAIGPATLRLLSYMQLQDKLIGIEDFELRTYKAKPYSIIIPKKQINSLPIIAPGGKPGLLPNFEKLLELKPDIIFVSIYTGIKNIELIAEKTNIPTVGLIYGGGKNFKNISYIEGSKASFKTLGEIFGKEDRAKELNDGIEKIAKELKSFQKKQTRSIYVGALRHKGQRGIVATDFGYMPFSLLGIKNVFTGKKKVGSVFIQKEALLTKDPDIIFLDVGGYSKVKEDKQKTPNFYKSLKAFKNNNVKWLLHSNFYSTSLCNLLINSYWIADTLGYAKVDKDKTAQDIYKLFFKENSSKIINEYYKPILKKIDD